LKDGYFHINTQLCVSLELQKGYESEEERGGGASRFWLGVETKLFYVLGYQDMEY